MQINWKSGKFMITVHKLNFNICYIVSSKLKGWWLNLTTVLYPSV